MNISSKATLGDSSHHVLELNGTRLHYVSAGREGSPILLVHGFPETWWTFHKLIPLLAANHRVFAVDLRGFGDSDSGPGEHDSRTLAEDLHQLIAKLDVGPVHLSGQDVSGAVVFRLATSHPEDLLSLTAIEMGLAGFGLEALADVTRGGAWHIGFFAAPGVPELLLPGHERELLTRIAFPAMVAVPGAVSNEDIDEFARTYSRPGGWRGAIGLYRSMLTEGPELRSIAETSKLGMPVLAIGAGGGPFTAHTLAQVAAREIRAVTLAGVGHYAVLEAPDRVAQAMLDHIADVDRARTDAPDAHDRERALRSHALE